MGPAKGLRSHQRKFCLLWFVIVNALSVVSLERCRGHAALPEEQQGLVNVGSLFMMSFWKSEFKPKLSSWACFLESCLFLCSNNLLSCSISSTRYRPHLCIYTYYFYHSEYKIQKNCQQSLHKHSNIYE